MQKTLHTLSELEAEAQNFAKTLMPLDGTATLVTLSGELGAGKTAFTKALAKALGVEDAVTSPTFVLEKIYVLGEAVPFSRLIHIDAYRLKEGKELAALGFDEVMREEKNLVILEWPEQVDDALPLPAVRIRLEPQADGSRTIIYG